MKAKRQGRRRQKKTLAIRFRHIHRFMCHHVHTDDDVCVFFQVKSRITNSFKSQKKHTTNKHSC